MLLKKLWKNMKTTLNVMNQFKKIAYFSLIRITGKFNPKKATRISYLFYKRNGMNFIGKPNYISSSVYFDGGNYSLIQINEGVTISNNASFLTHAWALNTVLKSMKYSSTELIGKHNGIVVGKNTFIGRGAIILPGVCIGEGSIVRGTIPDFSLVIGNSCQIIGDIRTYARRFVNID